MRSLAYTLEDYFEARAEEASRGRVIGRVMRVLSSACAVIGDALNERQIRRAHLTQLGL